MSMFQRATAVFGVNERLGSLASPSKRATFNKSPSPRKTYMTTNTILENHLREKSPEALDEILRKQSRLLQQFRKNETRYVAALKKINEDIKVIKGQTRFIKVENGQTIQEYMLYKHKTETDDRRKRFDCLALLNNYASSLPSNNQNSKCPSPNFENSKFNIKPVLSQRNGSKIVTFRR